MDKSIKQNSFTNTDVELHCAIRHGDLKRAKNLLVRGADPNANFPRGWTSLHMAAAAKSVPLVELLLRHGADACRESSGGLRASDIAQYEQSSYIKRLLRAAENMPSTLTPH